MPSSDPEMRSHQGPRARVPEGTVVYAVGDIHGRADLLYVLLEKIKEDTQKETRNGEFSRRVLIFLGDYVDRGGGTFQVIRRLSALTETGGFEIFREFDIHFLKGNHEDALIKFLDTGEHANSWLDSGGRETLISYGIDTQDAFTDDETARLWHDFRAAMPGRHLEFLHTLDHHHVEGDYFFVHAGARPGVALDAQNPAHMIWNHREFLSSRADFGKIIIHGHSPNPEPVIKANRIGIDTGAYYSNHLTALILKGTERRFLHT